MHVCTEECTDYRWTEHCIHHSSSCIAQFLLSLPFWYCNFLSPKWLGVCVRGGLCYFSLHSIFTVLIHVVHDIVTQRAVYLLRVKFVCVILFWVFSCLFSFVWNHIPFVSSFLTRAKARSNVSNEKSYAFGVRGITFANKPQICIVNNWVRCIFKYHSQESWENWFSGKNVICCAQIFTLSFLFRIFVSHEISEYSGVKHLKWMNMNGLNICYLSKIWNPTHVLQTPKSFSRPTMNYFSSGD